MPPIRRPRRCAVLAVAVAVTACGAHRTPYVTAARTVTTISSLLQGTSDVLDAAYRTGALSGAALNQCRAALEPVAVATAGAIRVLRSWPATAAAAPSEIQTLLETISEAATAIAAALPDGPTKTALATNLATAKVVAQAILDAYATAAADAGPRARQWLGAAAPSFTAPQ